MGKEKKTMLIRRCEYSFSEFMRDQISRLAQQNRVRTCETYSCALRSFMFFRNGKDIQLGSITSDVMIAYENHLRSRAISMNTVSFYMRILRAVYNRAVDAGLAVQLYPFRHVYTGIDKTAKRAIPLQTLKRLKHMQLSGSQEYARDMFLFSFYTRGMSFVDMAYLKKSDLKKGILFYRRKKTGQQLRIRWEMCMERIVRKYFSTDSPYLLPIICCPGQDERKQYKNSLCRVNRNLKILGYSLGLSEPLTMYISRHSWASIARNCSIPLSVISESLGHDSEATTQIYLASLDNRQIDRANRKVLNLL